VVYLHFTGFGALLVSGFWALVNERFDPRTARGALGRITAGASLGGLLGGILPERVGAALQLSAMLPLLALLHLLAAVLVLSVGRDVRRPSASSLQPGDVGASGFHVLRHSQYLQRLALLVTLTAAAEGTLDYVFKLRATTAVSSGEELLRLFAAFYTATALLGILVQVTTLRRLLQVLGLARSAAVLPAGVTAGAGLSLVLPGLGPVMLARGAEVILRSSLFRAAYELLFTPVAPREKRAVKLLLDVGAARVGDVAAGGLIQTILAHAGGWVAGVLLGTSMLLSALALAVARRLHLGYATALAGSLRRQVADLPPAAGDDAAALLQTAGAFDLTELRQGLVDPPAVEPATARRTASMPAIADRRGALQSRQPEEVRAALREGPLSTDLAEAAVGLLAWDAVAVDAILALRESAEAHVPMLVRRLLDPDEDFAIRRRLVTVLADQTTQEAMNGLVGALDDQRFEVRYRAGRALRRMLERLPGRVVDRERMIGAVLREVTVDRSVWESRQLIDAAEDDWAAPVAHVVRERANRSLEHVFTLLSLFLPRATIQLAYQGLNTDEPHLRGTALEYLETVLPEAIRQRLWPFLEAPEPRPARALRPAEEVLRQLLASRESIVLALDAARIRARPPTG
jgi:hypothetical protein